MSETIPAFYFDQEELKALADRLRTSFAEASPFPHVVIDNFVPEPMLDLVVKEFPKPDDIEWEFYGPGATSHTADRNIEKIGTSDETQFGPFTRHFMAQLNSHTFLKFLHDLTRTRNLVTDPSYNFCGLHSTGRGGKLMIHTDYDRHPIEGMEQVFNLILFINKDWKDEYGGHLELWSKDHKQCEQKILPIFNRCVIFETDAKSYHGHPHPLTCPEGRRRNTLALYYYMFGRERNQRYQARQDDVGWVPTTDEDRAYQRSVRLKDIVWKLTPPICWDVYDRLRGRGRRLSYSDLAQHLGRIRQK